MFPVLLTVLANEIWQFLVVDGAGLELGIAFVGIVASIVYTRSAPSSRTRDCTRAILLLLAAAHVSCLLFLLTTGRVMLSSGFVKQMYPELAEPRFEVQFDDACKSRMDSVRAWWHGDNDLGSLIRVNIDGYVASHLFTNAIATAFVVRNPIPGYMISLSHEILEHVYRDVYPAFAECWWDSYILDIGANTIGCFILAPLLMKALNMEYWGFTPIAYLGIILSQCTLFPLMFWLPNTLGLPPKHKISILNMLLTQIVWTSLVGKQLRTFMTPASKKALVRDVDWVRWDIIVSTVAVLSLSIVYMFNNDKEIHAHELQIENGILYALPLLFTCSFVVFLQYGQHVSQTTAATWFPGAGKIKRG